jgi:hypothetical protein
MSAIVHAESAASNSGDVSPSASPRVSVIDGEKDQKKPTSEQMSADSKDSASTVHPSNAIDRSSKPCLESAVEKRARGVNMRSYRDRSSTDPSSARVPKFAGIAQDIVCRLGANRAFFEAENEMCAAYKGPFMQCVAQTGQSASSIATIGDTLNLNLASDNKDNSSIGFL